jgi:hypothetical protein
MPRTKRPRSERLRPAHATVFERDTHRLNAAWGKYGFRFHYSQQDPDDSRQPKEHIICGHNKLGALCERLRWEGWRPCFASELGDWPPLDGEYESMDTTPDKAGLSDWRRAALLSLEPEERLPKPILFSKRRMIEAVAWRDPFIVSVAATLLSASINSPHHAYSPAGPVPAPR